MSLSFSLIHSSSHFYSFNHFHFLSLPSPLSRRPSWPRMDSTASTTATTATTLLRRQHNYRRKDKIVVIMGATGSGKSGLSVDLATRFPSEIINCDKMQVYKGLDITTNKIPLRERLGVPHHLLGEFDPLDGEVSPAEFRNHAGAVISDVASRRKLPLIVGGSNSFIHSLLVNRFDPTADVFDGSHSVSTEYRYRCCFIWVDVSLPVLSVYLSKRVDDMLDSGMFEELVEFYDGGVAESEPRTGLKKAIGVPEFDRYFKRYPPKGKQVRAMTGTRIERDPVERGSYEEAVRCIKDNTCQLAKKQIGKILRLKGGGWELKRVDATEAFRAVVTAESEEKWSEIWERQVMEPSVKIVKQFLEE